MPAGKTHNALQLITDPIGWLKEFLSDTSRGLEEFCRKYYGIYPGRVIDNADPQGRGRVRATCPAIRLEDEDDVSDDYWMMPCMNGLGTDPETGQMTGIFHPPDVGTNIWVSFQFGNPEFPVYMGGFVTTKNKSNTFDSEDALRKGMRTSSGHYIRMSDDPDDLHLIIGKGDGSGSPTPMFLNMSKEGHCTLTNKNGSMLYMNAEDSETSLMTVNGSGEVVSLLMLGDDKVTLSTKSGGAIGINGRDITVTGDNMIADCSKEFSANSGSVKLGKGALEPAVRGMKFMMWSLLHQHTITVPVPGSPTGPGPTPPPMLYNELSEKVFIS